eukprot:CAMPEP_0172151796 /NCGR_PEP_ID=MMETSP1050-20130122/446_1 /TAXON_ID=233186 /ORGANISM="Cryptomonas curvata, Strain CCAP979/52" /LENGTH=81 /DNA_ID=CAMNT_0012819977 /DNA_START=486 /DNA_END=731 /DNA_ORIENTATION=+
MGNSFVDVLWTTYTRIYHVLLFETALSRLRKQSVQEAKCKTNAWAVCEGTGTRRAKFHRRPLPEDSAMAYGVRIIRAQEET